MYRPKFNLSDTTPAAPAGCRNVQWQTNASDPPDISANVPLPTGAIGITIDGGGSVPPTGSQGFVRVPYAGTITGWTLLADVVGDAQITVKKSTFAGFPTTASIVASAPPSMTGVQGATSATLTGWTTAVDVGDIFEFVLDSATTCTWLAVELEITKD